MASDVGLSNDRQSRFTGPTTSKPSSKNSKGKDSTEKDAKEEWANKADYVNLLGDDIFEAFVRRRDEALRATAELRKMMLLTRHSVRYIDSHERSLANEFQRFLEFAEQQRRKEARRAKLLGLPPPRSAPANMFAVRPVGSFAILPARKRVPEEVKGRRSRSKRLLKMQMEHIQNIRVARTTTITTTMRSLNNNNKGNSSISSSPPPPLQAIDLSDAIRKKPVTPRRPTTQFSAQFLQEEPPHYAGSFRRKARPATVPAEMQTDLYRWMTDFFREHVPNESREGAASCRTGSRISLKDSQIRDEQMLNQLCSIASVPVPSYIAEGPWYALRKSMSQPGSQRGLRLHHLHSPPAKQPKREMKIDLELAAQLEARKMENMRKKTPQLSLTKTSSLGKRKRRPQTAASSPQRRASRKLFQEDAADTVLNSVLFLQEAGVEEVSSVRYICLANRGISNVISQELASYTSLRCLDLSGNHVSLMSLSALTALRKLILLGNQQSELEIPEGSFQELEILDVSYNLLKDTAMTALSFLPSLRNLNVNNNNLELIPPEATKTGAFVRLETLSAARNNLSSTSLVSLSRLPWLETLNLHKNHIKCIPDQIAFEVRAFSRLETLDLVDNPINYHPNLIGLEKMQKLRKVFLWDTPLSRTVTYTGSGKCSPRSVPILQAAMRAQRAGQNWYLVKTDKLVKDGWYSDKLIYAVHDSNPPGISSDQKFKARFERSRRVEEEVQKAMLHKAAAADRKFYSGPTSLIAESPETKEAELFIADSRKVTFVKRSPRKHFELEEEAKDTTERERQDLTQILLGSMDWKNASSTRKKSSTNTPRKKTSDKFKNGA